MNRNAPHALATLCVASLLASPLLGDEVCHFEQECYMMQDCAATTYEITLELDRDMLTSQIEDMEIMHYHKVGETTQIVAQGMGALNMLTIGANTALLSVHIGAGPAALTYIGNCGDE